MSPLREGTAFERQTAKGERFRFGANWEAFLRTLDDERVEEASKALARMLETEDLSGLTFLDIGSGSGLSSLAARKLGAAVFSFDFDPQCVGCTEELKRRFFPGDPSWTIREGSILDADFLADIGRFDIVYSWGVLHHTGKMTRAIELASGMVKEGGVLFLAIYNDQGGASRRWLKVKRLYNRLPRFARPVLVILVASIFETRFGLARLAGGRNPLPSAEWRRKKKDRGMSAWHDWVDWCGGLPFEVAKPEEIIVPLAGKGFCLRNLTTVMNGWGCNQYVFRRRV